MEENNTKKLVKILLIVIIIVMIIVIISLISYFSKTDKYGYEGMKKYNEPTTKIIDNSYKEATIEEKISYNQLFNNKDFLLPMNTIIKKNWSLDNINLIQSDEAKFEYIFTKLNQESLTLEEINNESKNVFNYEISSNLISKYLKDNSYIFNFQEEYPYCFKLKKIKKVSDKTYLNLDIIEFNEEKCSQDNLNYDSIREGVLILKNTEDKYYIELFALIKKEG